MNVEALDQAMMEDMVQAAEYGDPGPFHCWRDDFEWPDSGAVASGAMPVAEAAARLFAQNTEMLTVALKHRPRSEFVLGFLQHMSYASIPDVDWAEHDNYNRVRAQRNAFVDDERNRDLVHAIYFECCSLADVQSPVMDVWRAVHGSEEAKLFHEVVASHAWPWTAIQPMALPIATRLMGEWVADPVVTKEEGWRPSKPPTDAEQNARRRVDAVVEWPELFRFAVGGSKSNEPAAIHLALAVYGTGREILNGSIDRDGTSRYPERRRREPPPLVEQCVDDFGSGTGTDFLSDDDEQDDAVLFGAHTVTPVSACSDLTIGHAANFAESFPPLVPPWKHPPVRR